MARAAYDAEAWMTPANGISFARLLLSPVLVVFILVDGPSYPNLVLGVLIALSDAFDGYLARRHGTTRSGAFLDPLADKVLVLGAMGALVAIGEFPWLPVALIALREVGISFYRSYWARMGMAIPSRSSAKVKTIVQEVAVALALVPHVASGLSWLPLTVLWASVLLTLGTGIQYVSDGTRALRTGGSR